MTVTNKKYHQLVLLWITDPAKFEVYLQKMAPIVSKYGGAADRIFIPASIWAESIELPHVINFVHYDSKQAFEEFKGDPAFKKIEHLRSESTKLISYEGYLTHQNVSFDQLKEREYNIEIVNFKNSTPTAYRKYEDEGESKMKEYGFVVEYKMTADSFSPSVPKPDLIKISYFSNAADKTKFEHDPMHKVIEQELYPNAIENVIWINGKIHPGAKEVQ